MSDDPFGSTPGWLSGSAQGDWDKHAGHDLRHLGMEVLFYGFGAVVGGGLGFLAFAFDGALGLLLRLTLIIATIAVVHAARYLIMHPPSKEPSKLAQSLQRFIGPYNGWFGAGLGGGVFGGMTVPMKRMIFAADALRHWLMIFWCLQFFIAVVGGGVAGAHFRATQPTPAQTRHMFAEDAYLKASSLYWNVAQPILAGNTVAPNVLLDNGFYRAPSAASAAAWASAHRNEIVCGTRLDLRRFHLDSQVRAHLIAWLEQQGAVACG